MEPYSVEVTDRFDRWPSKLKDRKAVAKILQRIDRLESGNFGDHRSVGKGVWELRLTHGPGYRLYYTVCEGRLIIVLAGGDKGSQKRDILLAQGLAQAFLKG